MSAISQFAPVVFALKANTTGANAKILDKAINNNDGRIKSGEKISDERGKSRKRKSRKQEENGKRVNI